MIKSIKYSVTTLFQEGHTFETVLLIHKSLYNGSTHSFTKYSHNLLHFGKALFLIFDTFYKSINHNILDKSTEVCELLYDLNCIYKQKTKTKHTLR